MKTWRWFVVGAAVISVLGLTACNAFLAAPLGRWNPADPASDTGTVINPSVDGVVNPSLIDFGAATASLSYNDRILMEFDLGAMPSIVLGAAIDIYLSSPPPPSLYGNTFAVNVLMILQDWNATTVTYDQTFKTNFTTMYTGDPPPTVLETTPQWVRIDVTDFVKTRSSGLRIGFIIQKWMGDTDPAIFILSESPTNKPCLRVWGY